MTKASYSIKVTFDLTRSVSKSVKSFGNLFEATYDQNNGGNTLLCGDVWLEPKTRELFYNVDKKKIDKSIKYRKISGLDHSCLAIWGLTAINKKAKKKDYWK